MGADRWDIFLAYASPERPRARALYDALATAGLRVFFDQAALRAGDNWQLLLPEHLRASSVVVVLVSSHTAAALYENDESIIAVEMVRRQGRRLVPVLLEPGVDPPYGTHAFHAIELFEESALPQAVDALVDLVRNPSGHTATERHVCSSRIPGVPRVFAGRDELVARLRASLSAGRGIVLTQTIEGMGGVGKTSVAAAVAESECPVRDVVWWVRAEQPAVLVSDLAELAPPVGLPLDAEPSATAGRVRAWLETTDRSWLLVFDNAADPTSVAPWLPRRGHGAVVVTSRNRNMAEVGEVVPVDVWPATVAEAFLRERVRRRNPAAATEELSGVLARLGGLPLALEQVAAWTERAPNRRFARYQALLDDAAREPFPEGTRPAGYEFTAATTWRVSIEAATVEAPAAGRVLAVLAFLASEDLPIEWLRQLAGRGDSFLGATADEVDDALTALHGYSLASVGEDDTVSAHQVVQAAARRQAPPEAAACAIRLLRAQVGGDASDVRLWPLYSVLAPHATAAADTAGIALPDAATDLWWVLNDLCLYHHYRGAVAEAIAVGERALRMAETHLPGDPNLNSRNNLAAAYQAAGDLQRAIPLYQQTLADRRRILGDDHPNTLTSRNNLAFAYRAAGDLQRAIPLYQQTLADCRRVLGDDHPNTLGSRNNLAFAYQAAGDLQRAIPLYQQTLADRRRVLGDDHPDTLTSRNNLAGAYQDAGDLQRAIALLEQTLADCLRVMGPDHPTTRTVRANLLAAQSAATD